MAQSNKGLSPTPASNDRIVAYDLARSFAIWGMILVHFGLVMSSKQPGQDGWLWTFFNFLDGRAAATFVVLAGVGVTLLSRQTIQTGSAEDLKKAQSVLWRRGIFLCACGFLNLVIWPGDILRVYGISFLLAAFFVTASNQRLRQLTLLFGFAFILLLLAINYDKNWDWETLTYYNLWTPSGLIRNLFYDGFRTVFPWSGLVFLGMWIGRCDLSNASVRRKLFWTGILLALSAAAISHALIANFTAHPHRLTTEEINALFGTSSMPPLPLFLFSAVGISLTVISASFYAVEWFGHNLPVRALVRTGRMAFTWYVAHIIIGSGGLIALGWNQSKPLSMAMAAGSIFFGMLVLVSHLWMNRFKHGPLEALMRRCSSGRPLILRKAQGSAL